VTVLFGAKITGEVREKLLNGHTLIYRYTLSVSLPKRLHNEGGRYVNLARLFYGQKLDGTLAPFLTPLA
jgi:hypothetical protein